MKKLALAALWVIAAISIVAGARPALANLSAARAFTLIRSVPPGEDIAGAAKLLGGYASERTVDDAGGIMVRRWGGPNAEWYFDALHDGSLVMASKVTWRTKQKRDQQVIFSQLTTEGKRYFGKFAKFTGKTEAEWTDGAVLVRAKQADELEGGVTLLAGVRDALVDSGKYGF
jgi:hypothetical protein